MAQLFSLSAVLQKGYTLPEGDDQVVQGVGHFTKCMDQFMNKDGGSYNWADELKTMTAQWEKLVLGYKETVPGTTDMSYKGLLEALPEVMAKLPAVIEEKAEVEVKEEP